jgi:D-xylose transport system substrate-binding protein
MSNLPLRTSVRLLTIASAATLVLTGCAGTLGDPGASGATKVALLLPESKTARYESFDRPFFEAKLESLGDYEVLYSNADQDPAKQQTQAEAALVSGVEVLVLDPVDSAASASIVAAANAQGIPVIAYDRFIEGGTLDYYVSFDNEKIGRLQGEALVAKLDAENASGGILMLNGSPTDANSDGFKSGAHSQIDGSGYPVLAEFDTPDWSPDKAQEWVAGQITQYEGQFSAVYAANDGTAGGAIAALKAANVSPMPIVTGQDAEISALQRIITGDQYATVYKAMREQAELAATIADRLARGEEVSSDLEVNGVPTTLLDGVIVTIDNIMDTVIADGIYTVDEICTPAYAAACDAAGIK